MTIQTGFKKLLGVIIVVEIMIMLPLSTIPIPRPKSYQVTYWYLAVILGVSIILIKLLTRYVRKNTAHKEGIAILLWMGSLLLTAVWTSVYLDLVQAAGFTVIEQYLIPLSGLGLLLFGVMSFNDTVNKTLKSIARLQENHKMVMSAWPDPDQPKTLNLVVGPNFLSYVGYLSIPSATTFYLGVFILLAYFVG